MSNKVKNIDIKKAHTTFFNDIINIFYCHIGYVTIKDSKYAKNNSVNPLYLFFAK